MKEMWCEIQPGLLQRPIGENEKFIKLIGDKAHVFGREHWSITAYAKFQLSKPSTIATSDESYRQAWQALRFEHPSIAATAEDDVLTYEVPNLDKLKFWTEETFFIHQNASCEDITASMQPSRYVTAHLLLREHAILFHFAHWRTDGYGALQLVDSYLHHLCQIVAAAKQAVSNWGEETKRLAPSIEDVLQIPQVPTESIVKSTKRCLDTLKLVPGSVGVQQMYKSGSTPRGTRSCIFHLTKAETSAVQVACQQHAISMLSAVHASCAALTYAEAAQEDREKPYTSTMRFSLRPYLRSPYHSPKFAAALYTGGYMHQISATHPWLTNAKIYQELYSQGLSKDFLQCRRQYAMDVFDRMQKSSAPPAHVASEIDISNVGNAEELVRCKYSSGEVAIEVNSISIGVETLTPQMYCFLWTYQGQLGFNLVYNEAFYASERIWRMGQRLKEILLAELDVGDC